MVKANIFVCMCTRAVVYACACGLLRGGGVCVCMCAVCLGMLACVRVEILLLSVQSCLFF